MDQAARGASALTAGNYAEAITHYTAAIKSSPTAVVYYIKRSTAYQRLPEPNYDSAVADAEVAVVLAQKRGKRELIAQAQLRRGIGYFGLGRWADAKFCFGIVKRLNEKESSLPIWEKKVEMKLGRLEEGDKGAELNVKEIPEVLEVVDGKKDTKDQTPVASKGSELRNDTNVGVQTPASKIRHEWYQTAENVVITLLAKGVPKDKAVVDLHDRSVSISFPLPTSSTYDFSLEPLFASINTTDSTSAIMSTKIELVLKKTATGQKWPSLEGSDPSKEKGKGKEDDSTDGSTTTTDTIKRAVLGSSTSNSAPSYPTSSRTGPKDWDKLATDLTKPEKSGDLNQEGDGVVKEFEDEEGDPVNNFFKKIYAGADPDTRRAMMKSYQESNGTALSTNWSEVGQKPVETSPPDGMEAKKWGA
ncbi:MAG: hypothetical protein M1827_000127 [Pycnora praestabilis]|nr:MAG: hypothetical protein M1827_000127 [Pycnora praestabilis]